jgi:ornithine carbamoyltransferase
MKRDLLTINDLNKKEIEEIFSLTAKLKEKDDPTILKGKVLGLVFNKPSTRTRVSFQSGILRLGGHSLFLSAQDLQVKRGETMGDTARVLSRFLDGIVIRTSSHQDVMTLAQNSAIPVINGLTDLYHPCQVLTDLYTIKEERGSLDNIKIAYIGDANNNVASSWVIGAVKLDISLNLVCPKKHSPSGEILNLVEQSKNIKVIQDPYQGVKDVEVIYTDVWVSMGQEEEAAQRKEVLHSYQVNQELLNKAKKDCLVMHCLPAHREEEITSQVLDGPNSIVWTQAENRMHVQKGILTFLLA